VFLRAPVVYRVVYVPRKQRCFAAKKVAKKVVLLSRSPAGYIDYNLLSGLRKDPSLRSGRCPDQQLL
jgi:hypothetical protein